jgi:competence ComEA-like helix-hairpin-helix protein
MFRSNKKLPEYLFFTRKERVGIICIVVMMMGYSCIPYLYFVFNKPEPVDHTAFEKEIAQLQVQQKDSSRDFTYRNYPENNYYQSSENNNYKYTAKGELFYFDPNVLSADGWVKLGVREKTANTIRNYVSKGGRFYKPEDIAKIWGLHEDEVKRLLPYVRIAAKTETNYNKYPPSEPYKNYEKPKYTITNIDINNADTTAFIKLPGIGSKLAARIIAFRQKLGGFYKAEQVGETYGLPDSTFQKIKTRLVVGNSTVKMLNINTASVDELKTHPYLRYNIANAIVQYRTQHGSFLSVTDIKKIMLVTDDIYSKAAPYLAIK